MIKLNDAYERIVWSKHIVVICPRSNILRDMILKIPDLRDD